MKNTPLEYFRQDPSYKDYLVEALNVFSALCHDDADKSGWYNDPKTGKLLKPDVCKFIALTHSELSEALEGYRCDLMDKHLPHRKNFEVELADAVIRIAQTAGRFGLDLGGAIIEKMEYNRTREDHKPENRAKAGGKKF